MVDSTPLSSPTQAAVRGAAEVKLARTPAKTADTAGRSTVPHPEGVVGLPVVVDLSVNSGGQAATLAAAASPLAGHDFAKEGRRARASIAMENLGQLVKQARMLQLLGGDAKTRARMAADIAKRIGEALKSYSDNADRDSAGDAAVAAAATSVSTPRDVGGAPASTEAATSATAQVTAEAKGVVAGAAAIAKSATAPAKADDSSAPSAIERAARDGAALKDKLGAAGDAAVVRAKALAKTRAFFNRVRATLDTLQSVIERGDDAEEHEQASNKTTVNSHADSERKTIAEAKKAFEKAASSIGHHGEGEAGGVSADTATITANSSSGAVLV